ncbi:MAG: 1-phosphofructokinase family hexose kinase [Verrucomicrobiota bacterium]|nr:1-phosphofructokinase family hexose kinase [Limisphaera sp.]MDW8382214.1 1-phosphofructokinase family hexose kinase [Verrucomicrobiota bacterium]
MTAERVVVLCANPAVDVEWQVDGVVREEKNRILGERRWAGDKGVNVARWLRVLGVPCRLILPIGGESGAILSEALRAEGLPHEAVSVQGETRVNVLVTDPHGRQWRFNRLGPRLGAQEWRCLIECLERGVEEGCTLVVLAGSLPRGIDCDAYAKIVRRAQQRGIRSVVDCDGETLRKVVDAGPFLVKPNGSELAAWWGHAVENEVTALRAARALSNRTGGWVMVSRGSGRALLVHDGCGRVVRRVPPRVRARNRLGAGDAMLVGACWAITKGLPAEDWLRVGVETGALATQRSPGDLPTTGEILRRLGFR